MVFKTPPVKRDLNIVSNVVASQADAMLKEASKISNAAYVRVLRRIKQLTPILLSTVNKLDSRNAKLFREAGFDMFADQCFWKVFEHALYRSVSIAEKVVIKEVRNVQTATENLICQHLNQELEAPHKLIISGIPFNLFDLNALPLKHVVEAKKVITSVTESLMNTRVETGTDIHGVKKNVSALIYLLKENMRNPVISAALGSSVTINDILTQQKYIDSLLNFEGITKTIRSHAKTSLKQYAPEIYGHNKKSILGSQNKLNAFLQDVSPTLKIQLEKFKKHTNVKGEHVSVSRQKGMDALARRLFEFKDQLSSNFIKKLYDSGVEAFLANEGNDWLRFKELEDQIHKTGELKTSNQVAILLGFIRGTKPNIKKFIPYCFGFDVTHADGRQSYITLKNIYDGYPKLFEQLQTIYVTEIKRTDGEAKEPITIRAKFVTIRLFVDKYFKKLRLEDKDLIARHGLHALVMNKNKILKSLRQSIKADCKVSKIELDTGIKLQLSMDWILEFYGLDTIVSYPVSQMKRKHHKDKQQKSRIYSLDETVNIAFCLEQALKEEKTTELQRICIKIARVILKTAWNLTPVLELEINDIFQINSPVDGTNSLCVRLFKRRANYDTQWHHFNIPASSLTDEGVVIGKTVRPVWQDLIDLRDTDCVNLRNLISAENSLKNRLVLTYSNYHHATVGLSEGTFFGTINLVLKNIGCKTTFDSRRIRKTGLNYIYKKVAKSFKEYQKSGQHSFDVFLKYYLEVNKKDSEGKLTNTLQIMGDYYNGRELSDDIIILTDIPANSKQTPNGSCVAPSDSNAKKSYNKEHYKLHKKNGSENTSCADFNACLFCPFYRLIADAEHVWRLLSYRNFIVAEMRNSIGEYDDQAQQQIYARTIEQRVDEILKKISKLNPKAVKEGEALLSENGIHPDWSLVSGN